MIGQGVPAHTGEEWFTFGWPQYALVALIVVAYLVLVFYNKLPTMASFKDFVDAINTAGGHIFILTLFAGWFFVSSMRFLFHILNMPDEVITKHDAVIMGGIEFVTGTAFGGAWGALIKTMSGGKANGTTPPPSDPPAAPAAPATPPPPGAAPLP
jgi:hypothetical protein